MLPKLSVLDNLTPPYHRISNFASTHKVTNKQSSTKLFLQLMFTAFEELKRKRGTPFANIIVNIILAPKCLLLFHCNIRIIPCQYPFLKFLSISQKKHNFKNAHIMRKNHDLLYLGYEGFFIFIHFL